MDKLTIDPEFRDKILPLTEDEFSLLEENILSDGALFSPLVVWEGIILDGHNRYGESNSESGRLRRCGCLWYFLNIKLWRAEM